MGHFEIGPQEAYNPYWSNPKLAKKIDALAQEKGATFTGSGIWDMTRLLACREAF